MHNERAGDAALMAEMLVEFEGCIAEICPSGAVGLEAVALADLVEVSALMKDRDPLPGFAIEAEGSPFVTGAVVAEKQDQRIGEFAVFLKVANNSPNALIHMFDHGGEGGHAMRKVFATICRK